VGPWDDPPLDHRLDSTTVEKDGLVRASGATSRRRDGGIAGSLMGAGGAELGPGISGKSPEAEPQRGLESDPLFFGKKKVVSPKKT